MAKTNAQRQRDYRQRRKKHIKLLKSKWMTLQQILKEIEKELPGNGLKTKNQGDKKNVRKKQTRKR